MKSDKTDKEIPAEKRRGGRPSRQEAEGKRTQIIDVATRLFFEQGYGATSIEAVAQQAGISKRTFYDRFQDKADLFGAVIETIIRRMRPADLSPLFQGESFEEILHRLARLALQAGLSPQALALQRITLAESARFPELAHLVSTEGTRAEAIRRIAELMEAERAAGRLRVEDCPFCAEQFLNMVLAVPQRRAMGLGDPMSQDELEEWGRKSVDLFLRGCQFNLG